MANGWTPERRARQAELIRSWKPWEKSTGPKTPDGKAKAARNGDPFPQWAAERAEVRNLRQWANELLREHRELLKLVKGGGA